MLTTANIRPTQGERYYAYDDYSAIAQLQEKSRWLGKAAIKVSLRGQIKFGDFKNLLHGYLPNGDKFRFRKPRRGYQERAALDCCFSAPKSISILALLYDPRVETQIHDKAVQSATAYLERNYAQTRISISGDRFVVNSANLLIAKFNHDSSRELDPHLHSHCLVINCTHVASRHRWYSLHNGPIHTHKKLLGMIYQNELAINAKNYGYELETVGKGQFEVKGFNRDQINAFSKRSLQIRSSLPKNPTWAERERIWRLTRAPKSKPLDRQELSAVWHSEAELLGFRLPEAVVSQDMSGARNEDLADAAIKQAIEHCSSKNERFHQEDLLSHVLEGPGKVQIEQLEQAIIRSPDLIYADGHLSRRRVLNIQPFAVNPDQPVMVPAKSQNPTPDSAHLEIKTLKQASIDLHTTQVYQDQRFKWSRNDFKRGHIKGQEFAIAYTDSNLAHIQYADGRFEALDLSESQHLDVASPIPQVKPKWLPSSNQIAHRRQQLHQEVNRDGMIGGLDPQTKSHLMAITPQELASAIYQKNQRAQSMKLLLAITHGLKTLPVQPQANVEDSLVSTARCSSLAKAISTHRQSIALHSVSLLEVFSRLEIALDEHFPQNVTPEKSSFSNKLSSTQLKHESTSTQQSRRTIDGSILGRHIAERLRANHGRSYKVPGAVKSGKSPAQVIRGNNWRQIFKEALGSDQDHEISRISGNSQAQGSRFTVSATQPDRTFERRIEKASRRLRTAEQAHRAANTATATAVRSIGGIQQVFNDKQFSTGLNTDNHSDQNFTDLSRSKNGIPTIGHVGTGNQPSLGEIHSTSSLTHGEPGIEPYQFKVRPGQLSGAITRRIEQRRVQRYATAVRAIDRSIREIHSGIRAAERVYATLRKAAEHQVLDIDPSVQLQLKSQISTTVQEVLTGQSGLGDFLDRLEKEGIKTSLKFTGSDEKSDGVVYETKLGDFVLGPGCDITHLLIEESQRIAKSARSLLNDIGLGKLQADGSLAFETKTLTIQGHSDRIRVFAKDGRGEILSVNGNQVYNFKLSKSDLQICDLIVQKVNKTLTEREPQLQSFKHKKNQIII